MKEGRVSRKEGRKDIKEECQGGMARKDVKVRRNEECPGRKNIKEGRRDTKERSRDIEG